MELYYVYQHINPDTNEIVYIGSGKFDRAWACRGGNRSKEHFKFIEEMSEKGYTLANIVYICVQGLTREESLKHERELIETLRPVYNKHSNKSHWRINRTFSKETCTFAKLLHEMGYGYQRIAFLLGAKDPKKNHMSTKRMISYVE